MITLKHKTYIAINDAINDILETNKHANTSLSIYLEAVDKAALDLNSLKSEKIFDKKKLYSLIKLAALSTISLDIIMEMYEDIE